jgi:hypothetical protein
MWSSLAVVGAGVAFMSYVLARFLWDAKQKPAGRTAQPGEFRGKRRARLASMRSEKSTRK